MRLPNADRKRWWANHWFAPVAALVAIGDVSAVHFGGWTDARIVEAALLFDFAVVLPLLYWWCYRARGKAAIVQAVALACFAIWATAKAVPAEHHHLLESFAWLRYIGLAGLAVLEIKLGVAVYKAVIVSGQSKAEAQARLESEGMPAWVAKVMAWEAALWRRAWLFTKRFFGKR